ncbi:hypothetical protein J5N97_014164 [Dioscorea zingiberensis]|uniref:SBP-type domain-containing protein n=1 Tax=Dioscorea zingiberensis TaxID=325984 RepID=A0A9D5HJ90_9LILI|nr:hypothetical protein J5N97_014164 [Dioscorea zingiberensis]
MEARLGGENHQLFGVGPSDMNGLGKKSLEWDLNDWNWDGDRFLASPLNATPSDCRSKQLSQVLMARGLSNNSSSCSEETELAIVGKGKGALEKRRRLGAVGDDEPNDEVGSFSLKLGGNAYPVVEADLANWEGQNGKRTKLQGASANHPICQVEGCGADLIVAFHLLQEFDDGKRSCRRRLAGHNKRRRKTHPEASVSGNCLTDDRASSYLLISLLRILTNLHKECIKRCEQLVIPATMETGSPNCISWMVPDSLHSSPPQTSGNSEPISTQSLSSSNGDAQSRTDRIVFKLFGKDPSDFPIGLRAQVLDWLSHSPTDMESYIRPGCIILTIYLCLPELAWKEHQIAFLYNGQVVLDTPLLLKSPRYLDILCISPIAVPTATRANFKVKGFGIAQSTVRILCAFEGKYLAQERSQALVEGRDDGRENGGSQCISFSCSLPNASGRGFIEIEDHGLSSIFFPFLVAEEDVCSEIRMLEKAIDVYSSDVCLQEQLDVMNARNLAIDFLHEMGWFLRRSQLISRVKDVGSRSNSFPLSRFWWLMTFAVDREWSAVVKKLLDLLFQGNVDLGNVSPSGLLSSSDLLHSAVRKKCKSIVELLLRYTPTSALKGTSDCSLLFRPDMLGPLNITPLHIAAASSGADNILDALTNDPGQLGIKAWRSARDSTGFTPEDYARARGYESYLQLVQKKINWHFEKGQVVLDIPGTSLAPDSSHKQVDGFLSSKLTGFHIEKNKVKPTSRPYCKLCDQQLTCHSPVSRSLLYRPVMLSMVGIAAVCVCVGLLLKSPPLVLYLNHPFRWESLGCGSM